MERKVNANDSLNKSSRSLANYTIPRKATEDSQTVKELQLQMSEMREMMKAALTVKTKANPE